MVQGQKSEYDGAQATQATAAAAAAAQAEAGSAEAARMNSEMRKLLRVSSSSTRTPH